MEYTEGMDSFSFDCGMIDAYNETVALGVKALAVSRPLDRREDREALIPFVHENCRKHQTKLYPEDDPLITDLVPAGQYQGKFLFLFYRADHVIEEYIRLKDRKKALVASGAYFGGNRSRIAWEYGRLLSLPEEVIRTLIAENNDKEQV
ncbi:hypothetical protein H7U37_11715 [Pseudoflavonifractor phocaeensis]|uniref:hypothetical protein n=1 Tax=Pseudoflavonifractor phocaeensis TaxID=1870988 RepID=UPI00195629AA|nr:hypothetical protein [Pseudoflavonifractor phocaeensis]MBM6869729.1 hypothetical protein [Pseudoflavonifractor phocaeensis]MBM6939180.1 hypothetical protein [Pseudoflavonifractor phocaeensis]